MTDQNSGEETAYAGGMGTSFAHEARPERRFATGAVRSGFRGDDMYGSINVPMYMSSTFVQDDIGILRKGFEYARVGNPTVAALEGALAEHEDARHCRVVSSGTAAMDATLRSLLAPGDHMILPNDVYGGTFRLVDVIYGKWGVEYSVVDMTDTDAVAAAIRPNTKVMWVETPTNPMLSVADITALSELVKDNEATLVVDNTFATPYLLRPLALGADVVVHSATKYLGGHSDVVGGAVLTNSDAIDEQIDFHRAAAGYNTGSLDAYLTLRGLRTLHVRMDRHCENAQRVAEFLDAHPLVEEVLYPGLPSHAGHEVAKRQMNGFGGMVSVRMAGGEAAARALCTSTKEFMLAESLGGVESLIEHPAGMTHLAAEESELAIPGDLVRISVGIEDIQDLLEDLEQGLNAVADQLAP